MITQIYHLSSCCQDQLIVVGGDEGTGHNECRACGRPADIWVDPKKKKHGKSPTSKAQDFADTLRDNPREIIAWAKREIREYQKLIKILSKKT